MSQSPRESTRRHTRKHGTARFVAALLLLALSWPAAAEAPHGKPGSHIPDGGDASEYWDLVAAFESGHTLFARFMITHEGPGQNTAIAYGHLVEPDGTTWPWHNGKREENWDLEQDGTVLDVGSSELYLNGPPHRLLVKKRKKTAGIRIDLEITPEGPPAWDRRESDGMDIDLLASGAQVSGSVWLRDMRKPLALNGRAGLTHSWMPRSEPDVSQRRIDFFSLHGDTLLYLREQIAPDGHRSGWLHLARNGKTLLETGDFALIAAGRSSAQSDPHYPLPARLALTSEQVDGEIQLGAGLLHHDPMEIIPQPFRFLLSFKMRPLRVWTKSPFDVSFRSDADPIRIRGSGITVVTYLNPASAATP